MKQYEDLNEDKTEFNAAINIGQKGEDVSLLQEELRKLGY